MDRAGMGFKRPGTGFKGPGMGFKGPGTGFKGPGTGFKGPIQLLTIWKRESRSGYLPHEKKIHQIIR